MILFSILLGAGLLIGTSIVANFWNDIVSWIKNTARRIVRGVLYGVRVFIKKIREAIDLIRSKSYIQDERGNWKERVYEREVPEHEVPYDIRIKAARGRENEISRELELTL